MIILNLWKKQQPLFKFDQVHGRMNERVFGEQQMMAIVGSQSVEY